MSSRLRTASLLATGALVLTVGPAVAGPGDPDPGFASGGPVITSSVTPATWREVATGIAIDHAGRLVLAGQEFLGTSAVSNDSAIGVHRFDAANGNPDTAFGGFSNGVSVVNNSTSNKFSESADGGVAVDSQDGVLVGGRIVDTTTSTTGYYARLVRLSSAGQTTYDVGPAFMNDVTGVSVDLTDHPLVVGSPTTAVGGNDAVLQRLTTAGQTDTTFGGGTGRVLVDSDAGNTVDFDTLDAVTVDGAGRIVVAGQTTYLGGNVPTGFVARLSSTGGLDTTFGGGDGVVTIGFPGSNQNGAFRDVAVDSANRVFVAGWDSTGGGKSQALLMRLGENGVVDTTFGTQGRVELPLGSTDDQYVDVAVTANGYVDAVGTVGQRVAVDRYTPTGAVDTAFGGGDGQLRLQPGQVSGGNFPKGAGVAVAGSALFVGATAYIQNGGFDRMAAYRLDGSGEIAPPAPPAPAAPPVPSGAITVPAKKKARSISGTAGPAGRVVRVELALQRVDKHLLKKNKRCLWVAPNGKFAKVGAVGGACAPVYVPVAGTSAWSFALHKLAAGQYVAYERVTVDTGAQAVSSASFKEKH